MKEERREVRFDRLAARIAHLRDMELTDAEMAKIDEIREEYRPKLEKALDELSGILTDEQKKARSEALKAGKSRKEVREGLNLTDEQKAKVEAVARDLLAVFRDELDKIHSVLSPEQQEKLEAIKEERAERVRDRMARAIANYRDLNLTEEQKTAINNVREEYRPRVHEAASKLRAAVRDEIGQILVVVKD
jgi:Spy/CpxP family protein refolding chaperone